MGSAETVVDWLDHSAQAHPDRPAVEDGAGRSISYSQLAHVSKRVQARLIKAGVRPGDRVGVFMRKSIDLLVAFHAILRSGAVYVPADPLAPASRTALMLGDCEATAVFVDEELAPGFEREVRHLEVPPRMLMVPAEPAAGDAWRIEALGDGNPDERPRRSPDDLACLLYTSGSTGKPKAVMVTHRNVVTFVDWCSGAFAPTPSDKFATHAPLHFSLSVFNLYVAWKHGGAVALIDEQTARVPQLVAPLIEQRGITVWFSTPTILSLLAQWGELPSRDLRSLRLVMFAGEPFPVVNFRTLQAQLPNLRYVHALGSTETHIMACHEVSEKIPAAGTAPIAIGKVCPHFRSRIIDEDGRPVPPGSDGELCLAGEGVTPGYWKSPEDNARAFFVDAGERWYRTGDLVRLRPDGDLEHRGRRDRMIKKRGNRVELPEIEACLHRHAGVKEVAVVAVADEALGQRVKAFVVPADGLRPTIIDLKAHCAHLLPAYMVPDEVAFREALPRTSTGKMDFSALKGLV